MSRLRALEASCGIVACGLGLATLVYALFLRQAVDELGGHCDATGQCVSYHVSQTIAENQGVASLVPAITLFSVSLIAIAVGAIWDARTDGQGARITLWLATALLTVVIFLSSLSIGLFFLPVWVLAVARRGDRQTAAS